MSNSSKAILIIILAIGLLLCLGFCSPTPMGSSDYHSGLAVVSHNPPLIIIQQQRASTDYVAIARADARASHISETLFVRQIRQESNFNPSAVSQSGAIGIAQFMPATAAGLGIDPRNPLESLKAAANLMGQYQWHYGSYAMALAAYNAGPSMLNNALAACRSWYACMPNETRAYISKIMG